MDQTQTSTVDAGAKTDTAPSETPAGQTQPGNDPEVPPIFEELDKMPTMSLLNIALASMLLLNGRASAHEALREDGEGDEEE